MNRYAAMGAAAMGALALALSSAPGQSQTAAPAAVPDFSGYWQRAGALPSTFENPTSGIAGPVIDPQPRDGDGIPWIGDHTNPILKAHAAEVVKKRGDFIKAGGEDLPAYSLCWPTGVPQVLNLREPVQFLQEPNMITILYQRDHQVRRIILNGEHSKAPKPSWYGESIGHYEGDNTLVVDTIGQNDKTDVDKFGTPHSDKIHVVERYSLSADKRTLTVEFEVTDPETFTTKWGAKATYRRVAGPVQEVVCAENNKNASTGQDYPIPVSAKADF